MLPLSIERFGAVLATKKGPEADPELAAFMAKMSGYAKVPLSALSAVWRWEQGKRVAVPRAESRKPTSGMTKIAGGPLCFSVKGIEIEGGGEPSRYRCPLGCILPQDGSDIVVVVDRSTRRPRTTSWTR